MKTDDITPELIELIRNSAQDAANVAIARIADRLAPHCPIPAWVPDATLGLAAAAMQRGFLAAFPPETHAIVENALKPLMRPTMPLERPVAKAKKKPTKPPPRNTPGPEAERLVISPEELGPGLDQIVRKGLLPLPPKAKRKKRGKR